MIQYLDTSLLFAIEVIIKIDLLLYYIIIWYLTFNYVCIEN